MSYLTCPSATQAASPVALSVHRPSPSVWSLPSAPPSPLAILRVTGCPGLLSTRNASFSPVPVPLGVVPSEIKIKPPGTAPGRPSRCREPSFALSLPASRAPLPARTQSITTYLPCEQVPRLGRNIEQIGAGVVAKDGGSGKGTQMQLLGWRLASDLDWVSEPTPLQTVSAPPSLHLISPLASRSHRNQLWNAPIHPLFHCVGAPRPPGPPNFRRSPTAIFERDPQYLRR